MSPIKKLYQQLVFHLPEVVEPPVLDPPEEPEKKAPLPAPLPSLEDAQDKGTQEDEDTLTARAQAAVADLGLSGFAQEITVRWNSRLRTTAGTADIRDSRVDLNPKICKFGEETVERTLRHELAHLVACHRAAGRKIQAHGAEWRKACSDLGIPGESSCHTLPLEVRRQRRKHAYRCPSCRTIVTRVRPFSRNTACWPCCKTLNNGDYSARFRFEKISLEEAQTS